jgi:DNA-binding NtrC family response regulator
VIAATRRDLDKEVQEGRFRDDLFHRLAVARIELPPLSKRAGDVPLLARHFAKLQGAPEDALPPEVLARWESEPWPGNIRELRNAVARQIALGDLNVMSSTPVVSSDTMMDMVLSRDLPLAPARQLVVDEFERRYLTRVLERNGGNVTQAARSAGVARRYFHLLRKKKLGQ